MQPHDYDFLDVNSTQGQASVATEDYDYFHAAAANAFKAILEKEATAGPFSPSASMLKRA